MTDLTPAHPAFPADDPAWVVRHLTETARIACTGEDGNPLPDNQNCDLRVGQLKELIANVVKLTNSETN